MKKTEFKLSELVIGRRYWLDSVKDESGVYNGNGQWTPDENVKTYHINENGILHLSGGTFHAVKN